MTFQVLVGDVLERLAELPDESVQCVVTSPPYWGLRDYGVDGQIGLEATPAEFLAKLVAVFREVRRVLRSDGTCWVNMGDAYSSQPNQRVQRGDQRDDVAGWKQASNAGSCGVGSRHVSGLKPKDLIGMPWRLAFALQEDGWWLRQDIIWAKPGPMPESVTDRCTKAHEYIFLLSKNQRYFFDNEAIKEQAVSDHPAGNTSHKGLTAYEEGDEKHRTKVGLVAFAQKSKRNSFARESKDSAGDHGQKPQHREDRDDIDYAGTRNKRSVWWVATQGFPEAHFATFPTKLVEPCILAGTSERGCCSNCGAPWERVTESQASHQSGSGKTGWKAGCACGAETAPCTVLDPFNGAGTTGVVAGRLGRDYVGIELNPEYAEMSRRRILGDNPMFNVEKKVDEPLCMAH